MIAFVIDMQIPVCLKKKKIYSICIKFILIIHVTFAK